MALPRVFISMGTPYTEDSARFRDELEGMLRDRCGIDPRIIGKNEYPAGNPLAKIREVMKACSGVIVVAYERKYVNSGTERRAGASPRTFSDTAYTTPWNHVESAMAYCLDLPIYIICQNGLAEECLIENKIDWYVQYADIRPGVLSRPDVAQSIQSWVGSRVLPRANKPRLFRILDGTTKLSEMTPKEITGAIGALTAAFALGAAVAKFVPRLLG